MRISTVFISSTFVLAGMSAAFPVETDDMLVARFADSDFLSEVEARAYDEEPELYVHGDAISTNNYKTLSRHRRSFYDPSPYELTSRRLPGDMPVENDKPRVTFAEGTKGPPRSGSFRPLSPPPWSSRSGLRTSMSNMLNRRPRIPGSNFLRRFRNRRSFDEPPRSELTRRHNWDPHRAETPPREVTWSPDTVDTPERPPRPPTPRYPDSQNGNGHGNGHGNGNGHYHYQHHRPRSFFDLDRKLMSVMAVGTG